ARGPGEPDPGRRVEPRGGGLGLRDDLAGPVRELDHSFARAPVDRPTPSSRVSRCARYTGTSESRTTTIATTFTTGRAFGSRRFLKIQMGSVSLVPLVKLVTTISSKESAKA